MFAVGHVKNKINRVFVHSYSEAVALIENYKQFDYDEVNKGNYFIDDMYEDRPRPLHPADVAYINWDGETWDEQSFLEDTKEYLTKYWPEINLKCDSCEHHLESCDKDGFCNFCGEQ